MLESIKAFKEIGEMLIRAMVTKDHWFFESDCQEYEVIRTDHDELTVLTIRVLGSSVPENEYSMLCQLEFDHKTMTVRMRTGDVLWHDPFIHKELPLLIWEHARVRIPYPVILKWNEYVYNRERTTDDWWKDQHHSWHKDSETLGEDELATTP